MEKILSEEERRTWEAEEPRSDFATRTLERMIRQSQAEGESFGIAANARSVSVVRPVFPKKGVLAPLLLVAIFFSFAAAAALGSLVSRKSVVSSENGTKGDAFSAPARQVEVGIPASTAHAEREPEVPASHKLPRRAGKGSPEKAGAPDTEQTTKSSSSSRKKEPLHFPQCECGTSGIVCSCAD